MAQSDDAPDEEGGAKSFDELREEYEDGAEWSEDEEGDAAAEEDPAPGDVAEAPDESDDEAEEATPADGTENDETVDDERVDALFEEDAATEDEAPGAEAGAHQPAPGAAAQAGSHAPPRTGARQPVTGGAAGEKPYLRELPSGYVSDLLVMEWVEFLVTESSPAGAHRAITYYENVGWVGHRAADQLREFVDGHPEASVDDEAGTDGALTMDHHTTSLRYVARITGDVQENVLASWDDGDNRWLQR
jgi:archaellum component FlaD/FlaE